ncbi:MAG: SRPBCC domain-containing protein [Pseudomonadota bacterium]
MTAPTFTMSRRFEASPQLVWRAWTEEELLQRWYGPGVETKVHRFEPTAGGLWLHEMLMGDQSMYQRIEFLEVEPPTKLVMLMSNANAAWEVIPSPMMQDWPRRLLTTVTFLAEGEGCDMTLEWTPYEATPAEKAAFDAALSGLDQGWGKGMDVIAEIVAELS